MWESNPWLRTLLILLTVIASLVLAAMLWEVAKQFFDIILIFFLAWLLAFVLSPLTNSLARQRHLPRIIAASIVYFGFLIVLIATATLILPSTAQQLAQLAASLPTYLAPLPRLFDGLQAWFNEQGINVRVADFYEPGNLVQRIEAVGTAAAQGALGVAQGIAATIFNAVLILILAFYILVDGERWATRLINLLPERFRDEGIFFLQSIDLTFGGFIRGLLIEMAIYGLGTAFVMLVAGLDFILPVSLFAGGIMVVPFVGALLAIVPPLIIALFTGDVVRILVTLIGLLVLQQLVLNVIGPKVMGESVGLHPLFVLFAILAGAKLAGIWGAIFGVPIAGVIFSMVAFFYQRAIFQRRSAELKVPAGSRTSFREDKL